VRNDLVYVDPRQNESANERCYNVMMFSSQEVVTKVCFLRTMQNLINFYPKDGDSIFFSKHQKHPISAHAQKIHIL
jgi:hypothetical protein